MHSQSGASLGALTHSVSVCGVPGRCLVRASFSPGDPAISWADEIACLRAVHILVNLGGHTPGFGSGQLSLSHVAAG